MGEFVIHENGNNIIIDVDADGHERRFDATLDPGYNRDINHYLANRKHWEITEDQFRLELEQEKAEVARRCTEMEKMRLICFPEPAVFWTQETDILRQWTLKAYSLWLKNSSPPEDIM